MAKRYYTPAEVADELSVSASTVLRLIHHGRLPSVRVSERIYRIPVPAFERFRSGVEAPDVSVTLQRGTGERIAAGERPPRKRRLLASPG